MDDEKIKEILKKVDQDDNKKIEYSEFLAHALTENHLSEKNINAFFRAITAIAHDKELAEGEEHYLNAENLQQFLLRSIKVYNIDKIKEMMDQCETHCQL